MEAKAANAGTGPSATATYQFNSDEVLHFDAGASPFSQATDDWGFF